MIENIFENYFFRYIKLSKQFSVDLKIIFFFLKLKKIVILKKILCFNKYEFHSTYQRLDRQLM